MHADSVFSMVGFFALGWIGWKLATDKTKRFIYRDSTAFVEWLGMMVLPSVFILPTLWVVGVPLSELWFVALPYGVGAAIGVLSAREKDRQSPLL